MVELSTLPQTPKSYRSLSEYIRSLQEELSSVITLLLGTGLVSADATTIGSSLSISYTLNSGEYTLSVTSVLSDVVAASYIIDSDSGVLIKSRIDSSSYDIIPFDTSNNILNGSNSNPIEVSYPNVTSSSPIAGYTIENIASVVYVNGTPQPEPDITVVSKNQLTRKAKLAFTKFIGGHIFPDPVTPDGLLTSVVFSGPIQSWQSTFGDPLNLRFTNLDVKKTNKPLILELYDINTSTYTYLKVYSSFQEDKPYYETVEFDRLKLYIPATTLAAFDPTSTIMKVYFATTVELETSASNNNRFFRQYKLPIDNLLPDDSDLKIFAISKTTGEVKELVSESNILIGDLYAIDYQTGRVSIYNINSAVPEDIMIAVTGFKYEPPVRAYNTSDYTNSIQVFYADGAVYEKSGVTSPSDLPPNLYLYYVPKATKESIESYISSEGTIKTSPQIRMFSNALILSESILSTYYVEGDEVFPSFSVEPILLGTLSASGYSYSFSPNPLSSDPYSRLQNLAATMPLIQAGLYTTERSTELKVLPTSEPNLILVSYIHSNATEVTFYGLSGKMRISDNSNLSTTKQYQVELGHYDHISGVFTPIQSLGTFDSGIDNGYIQITQPTFPNASIWSTTSPTNNVYLALRITVTNPAGELEYLHDYDLSIYHNIKY